ncbi:MAG: YbaK/EbsC family protein [Gemmatimonadota bacterium]
MPVAKLKEFLDAHHVHYDTIAHGTAYTAQEAAAAAHVPGKELAKTVMVKLDGELAMVVLPAPDHNSLERLREATGAGSIELATEVEFKRLFPTCEPGAMPPFGNLWDLEVFVDQRLREDERIAFEAGRHDELVRMSYIDFERLVQPVVTHLTTG